jgi:hypothetical protein
LAKILKIDFHTHPIEALKDKMGIRGIGGINREVAAAIVESIKSAGLNGIAITEHGNFNHSWVASLEIMDHFQKERLIILPGVEVDFDGQQCLQIYVPDYYRRRIPFFNQKEWFSIMAHPGLYHPVDNEKLTSCNFDAVEEKSILGEFPLAGQISQERKILLTRSSDAHKLEDIGYAYTEVELR